MPQQPRASASTSLKRPSIEREAKKFGTADVDYIFDQAPERLFRHLMPRYVTTQIFHALLRVVAAEHAARMTATDAATKNAGDLIDSLVADHEPGAAGSDHQGNYRDCERRGRSLVRQCNRLNERRRDYGREYWKSNFDQRPGR